MIPITPPSSFFPKLLLVSVFILSGCVTGFDSKEWSKAMKGIRELNDSTRLIEEATFRHKQEAYYDQQLRKSKYIDLLEEGHTYPRLLH